MDSSWTVEHSVTQKAPAQRIWEAWQDVERWPAWNPDIEEISLEGRFQAGAVVVMTPAGQPPVRLRIVDVDEGGAFTDEATVGDMHIRTTHRVEQHDDRSRVTYRLEAGGPQARELGRAISADFPEVIANLFDYATR